MAIVYSGKIFAGVINDGVNFYYSDPDCNAKLGMGEKFYAELRGSSVVGSPTMLVGLQSSNDNINWKDRNTTVVNTLASWSGAVVDGAEPGATTVGGRFQRFTLKFTAGTSPAGYIELWVTARNAF